MGQDKGAGLQRTLAATDADGRVPTAGQDQKEVRRDGSLVPEGKKGPQSIKYYSLRVL